jgi:hypothetical protein
MTLSARDLAARSRYHRLVEPQDWARVQRLYVFCRARAIDRNAASDRGDRPVTSLAQFRDLHTLETMYAKARASREGDDVVTSCAVTYFRMTALRDADHPDFLREWI